MLLRYEEGIEIPESRLDKTDSVCQFALSELVIEDLPIGWHFCETHLKEDISELAANLVYCGTEA